MKKFVSDRNEACYEIRHFQCHSNDDSIIEVKITLPIHATFRKHPNDEWMDRIWVTHDESNTIIYIRTKEDNLYKILMWVEWEVGVWSEDPIYWEEVTEIDKYRYNVVELERVMLVTWKED